MRATVPGAVAFTVFPAAYPSAVPAFGAVHRPAALRTLARPRASAPPVGHAPRGRVATPDSSKRLPDKSIRLLGLRPMLARWNSYVQVRAAAPGRLHQSHTRRAIFSSACGPCAD